MGSSAHAARELFGLSEASGSERNARGSHEFAPHSLFVHVCARWTDRVRARDRCRISRWGALESSALPSRSVTYGDGRDVRPQPNPATHRYCSGEKGSSIVPVPTSVAM